MKKLLLIRHAKAGSHDISDFERPLTEQGWSDAALMAHQLKQAALLPEYILFSPSLRTKTTARMFSQILAIENVSEDKAIYEAATQKLLNIINHLPDNYSFVAIVGHNPGVTQLLYELTGEMRDMSPADTALISFDFDVWETVHADTGKLAWYGSPKVNGQ